MSSHRVIYLISQWHPGNEWCLQEMNTAQPIATGKPQVKILEIVYFSAQLPSGEESRERALLTLQAMELKWHRVYSSGRVGTGPALRLQCCAQQGCGLKTEHEASKTGPGHLELSSLDSLLLHTPQHHQFTWLLRSHSPSPLCPFTASEVEVANTLRFPAQLLGNLKKLLRFIQRPPQFAWMHLYIVICKNGACLRQVTSLGTDLCSE